MDHVLDRVVATIDQRHRDRPAGSYVVRLLDGGPAAAGAKVLEEARELVEAATDELGAVAVAHEAADLVFHTLVLLRASGVDASAVWSELARREGTGGLAEKAARPPKSDAS